MWGLCGILTVTNVFQEGHLARTDVRIRVLNDASWFYVPYPGQFGAPTVTLAGKKRITNCTYLCYFIIRFLAMEP